MVIPKQNCLLEFFKMSFKIANIINPQCLLFHFLLHFVNFKIAGGSGSKYR